MDRTQINKELELLGLKNKLQTNLKLYLETSTKPYVSLDLYINTLKCKYNENVDIINELERLRQNINFYASGQELLRVENWIFNWNNKCIITDMNSFVDTSRNYELEEQIKDLQKQINEIKEINLQQNPYIERIDENTNL